MSLPLTFLNMINFLSKYSDVSESSALKPDLLSLKSFKISKLIFDVEASIQSLFTLLQVLCSGQQSRVSKQAKGKEALLHYCYLWNGLFSLSLSIKCDKFVTS